MEKLVLEKILIDFGHVLRKQRLADNDKPTIDAIAAKVDLHSSTISRIERGEHSSVKFSDMLVLANYWELDLAEMFGLEMKGWSLNNTNYQKFDPNNSGAVSNAVSNHHEIGEGYKLYIADLKEEKFKLEKENEELRKENSDLKGKRS